MKCHAGPAEPKLNAPLVCVHRAPQRCSDVHMICMLLGQCRKHIALPCSKQTQHAGSPVSDEHIKMHLKMNQPLPTPSHQAVQIAHWMSQGWVGQQDGLNTPAFVVMASSARGRVKASSPWTWLLACVTGAQGRDGLMLELQESIQASTVCLMYPQMGR